MDDYILLKEAAELWNTDASNLGKLCRKGKIAGAKIIGRNWVIPKNTPKPTDGRIRKTKGNQSTDVFRFPLYINLPQNGFAPPPAAEEIQLRQAQVDFFACEFEKSKIVFEDLADNAENIYVKICSMFFLCVLASTYDGNINMEKYFFGMKLLLSAEFPYKREMELFLPLLDFFYGSFLNIPDKLYYDDRNELHPTAWYMYIFLSSMNYEIKPSATINPKCTEPFGTLCRLMERDGYYFEAQELHICLFSHYYCAPNQDEYYYHLRQAVRLAYEHNLLYPVADIINFYSNEISTVLSDYPDSFAEKIMKNGKIMYENFSRFTEKTQNTSIFLNLSESDYPYVLYAMQGFTGSRVAELCKVSVRTVAKRYTDIYNKLGINSKQELIKAVRSAFGDKNYK